MEQRRRNLANCCLLSNKHTGTATPYIITFVGHGHVTSSTEARAASLSKLSVYDDHYGYQLAPASQYQLSPESLASLDTRALGHLLRVWGIANDSPWDIHGSSNSLKKKSQNPIDIMIPIWILVPYEIICAYMKSYI